MVVGIGNSCDIIKDFPVDIVYLWCDSHDKKWCEKKNNELKKYGKSLDKDSTGECRFIENDELKYSLRSLEKYAPWINNIFIVTDNQIPSWLDTSNPKIHIIDHKDILPTDNLPTFNASAIESAIHKIPNLSEHFLFANDDMFFGNFVSKKFFFNEDGLPIFRFSNRRIINKVYKHLYGYMISHAYKLVKKKYGKSVPYFPHHNIDAYRKSDIEKCYMEYKEGFENTAKQKFREKDCIQRSIYEYYSLANSLGEYKIVNNFSAKLNSLINKKPLDSIMFELKKEKLEYIKKIKPYLFCLNDGLKTDNDDRIAMKIFLEQAFPEPSTFEKDNLKNADILICYHKEFNLIQNEILKPIQVGAEISNIDLGVLKDNSDDNISAKNKYYSELTALYWLWKNSDASYKGLMHYRRLFDLGCGEKRWYHKFPENIEDKLFLNKEYLNFLLSDYDIILPMKRVISKSKSIYEYYKKKHYINDLDRVLEIIKSKTPEIYPVAEDIIKNKNEMYLYNMFVSTKEFLNDYASWLFDILFTLEAEIQSDIENRDLYQQRVYGFLSERLFTVYVEYRKNKGLKVKEVPVVYCELNKKRYDIFQLRTKIYKIITKFGIRKKHWKEQYGV